LAAFRVEFDAACALRWKHEISHSNSSIVGKHLDGTSVHENAQSKFAAIELKGRGSAGRKILIERCVAGVRAIDEELLFVAIEPD
jgi:hypothetical protein